MKLFIFLSLLFCFEMIASPSLVYTESDIEFSVTDDIFPFRSAFNREKLRISNALRWIEEQKPYMLVEHLSRKVVVFYKLRHGENGFEFCGGDGNPQLCAYAFYLPSLVSEIKKSVNPSVHFLVDPYFDEGNPYQRCLDAHAGQTFYLECSEIYQRMFRDAVFDLKSTL